MATSYRLLITGSPSTREELGTAAQAMRKREIFPLFVPNLVCAFEIQHSEPFNIGPLQSVVDSPVSTLCYFPPVS